MGSNAPLIMLNKDLTPEDKFRKGRIKLMRSFPFYAYLSIKLNMVEDESIGTAAVDANNNIYYAPSYIDKMSEENIVFMWAHEVCHCLFDHIFRVDGRDMRIWNIATDIAINLILIKDGVGEIHPNWYNCPEYAGQSAVQIYEDLIKNPNKIPQLGSGKSGRGPAGNNGSCVDNHDKWGDEAKPGESNEEAEARKAEWRNAAVSAAHAAKEAGAEVPESFRGLIKSLTETKITWYDFIRDKIRSYNREEKSFRRINRRRKLGDFNMPGKMPGKEVEFYVGIDVSGSFGQSDVDKALSEIYGATREFSKVKIHVFQWDTRIYNYKMFDESNINEMFQYKIDGGGGTDFNCVINWLKKLPKAPTQLFVFTDLYFTYMPDPNICPTCFIAVATSLKQPPYGDIIEYEAL